MNTWSYIRVSTSLPRLTIIVLLSAFLAAAGQDSAHGQTADQPVLLQLTGYILEDSTDIPLPYAHILNPRKGLGKVAGIDGYFSIVASPGDTLKISNIGYHDHFHVVVPADKHLIVKMVIDVRQLPATEVRPWPKSMMALRQDLKFRNTEDMSTVLAKNMVLAGFKPPPTHPTPPPPTIMNPISFIYERVIKKIQQKRPKKNMVDQMPPIN